MHRVTHHFCRFITIAIEFGIKLVISRLKKLKDWGDGGGWIVGDRIVVWALKMSVVVSIINPELIGIDILIRGTIQIIVIISYPLNSQVGGKLRRWVETVPKVV